ncbi:MAG TPA: orotidine-5'-phosphate decarboxylase [Candidatus Saccharimonadales bacterium]|jgi:orotidine-5'-phosphate decarboxylase|nr:orotidine-5'-phosphate decarboxylase [Candidatus Saccharimonadales bacterium]
MGFLDKLAGAWEKNDSLLCVGLDPDMAKLPPHLQTVDSPYFTFNKEIIDATADLVCAFKPNSAFYEARGAAGIEELNLTCEYIRENHPDIPIILDFKRGDIGNTNNYYATFAFDYLGVDAVTVQPWAGHESLQLFLDYKDKGIIVLDRTSNSGSGEFQDLLVDGQKLYLKVAQNVKNEWNANGNCQLVVGATYPKEMTEIRQLMGDEMVFLVPGLGAQGGEAGDFVKAGVNSRGNGLIINSSRAILYASSGPNFAEVARAEAIKARAEINKYRGE